jgi:peptidyl-prolyl cis-trans isomerase C
MLSKFRLVITFVFAFGALATQGQTLVSGSGVAVGVQDVDYDLIRVTPEIRANTFGRPEMVQNNVANIFVRRALAAEAVKDGLEKSPIVKAALDAARDRILSDARLEQIDQLNVPNLTALTAYAQTTYNTNPKKFESPQEIKISHILLLTATPNARAEIEKILEKLKAGANFDEIAKAQSQDQGSAAKGGNLGFVTRGRMVKPFEDAAFKLTQPGELSPVVESSFGLHIIKLEENRPAGIRSFESVKETLINEARTSAVNSGRQTVKEKILSTASFDLLAIEAFAKAQKK